MSNDPKQVVGYTVDLSASLHRYVSVDGVGEYRENFAGLVASIEHPTFDAVLVAKAELLFVDTSPMWMEKLIATAQRNHITVAAADTGREYDLTNPQDEADFRTLGKQPWSSPSLIPVSTAAERRRIIWA